MNIILPSKFEPQKPYRIQDFQEITIGLLAVNFQPSIITEKTLQQKQIIPQDWQLKPQKVVKPNLRQFLFKNGFKIETQLGKIYFNTTINQRKIPICQIVKNFVSSFPQLIYSKVEILPTRLISLPGDDNVARDFIINNLFLQREWQNFQNVQPKIQVQFYYQLQKGGLNLKITNVKFSNSQKIIKPALLFKGAFSEGFNFNYKTKRKKKIETILDNYDYYLASFNKIINSLFND